MSGQSVTKIIGGPALVTFRGASFFSKGDIALELTRETFPIETDAFRQVDERVRRQPISVSFTPVGEWENLSVLYAYAGVNLGDYVTPTRAIGVIVSNTATCYNHHLLDGDAVYVTNSGGALPSGLSAATLYYVHGASSDAITFHTNRADAILGTNVMTISGGTGTNRLVVNNPLTIQTFGGKLLTFPNAAVTRMPGIIGSATQTLLEEVQFEAYLKDGAQPSDTGSYYSITDNPYAGDSTFDPASILTQPITLAWGAVSPWDNFGTKNGVRIAFDLTLEDVDIDGLGTLTKRIGGLMVTARAQPVGISEEDLMTKMGIQGVGAAIGKSLGSGSDDLVLTATGFYAKLTAAALRGGPQAFSSRNDRIGELTWVATRTFTNGLANPLFVVGTSTPT